MPYLLNGSGIQVATQQELVAQLTGDYEEIYGQSIDLSSSSQDGQMMMIYIQAQLDVSAMLLNIYNSRNADSATGTQLDTLFWWLPRQGGSFTIQPLTVVVSAACTLYGLDQSVQPVFTYADPNGNAYQLQATQNPPSAGTYIYSFQAANSGNVTSPLNSITVPVTVNLAVTSVNNPVLYTFQGQNEETDFAYRLRGLASTAIAAQGFFDSLFATLGAVPQASQIEIYENYGDTVSPNSTCSVTGVPAHGIWVIVQGTATPASIAQAIYAQRSDGCNMKGLQTYDITRLDGSLFTVQWDFATTVTLWVKMTLQGIAAGTLPNLPLILTQLPADVSFKPGGEFNVNALTTLVQVIDPNTLVTASSLATSQFGTYGPIQTPALASQQFVLAKANIYALPLQLLPAASTVVPAVTIQFTAYGGTQAFTYTISVNNSGGSITSGGLYTAGSTPGIDTVQAEDGDSNLATAQVTVT